MRAKHFRAFFVFGCSETNMARNPCVTYSATVSAPAMSPLTRCNWARLWALMSVWADSYAAGFLAFSAEGKEEMLPCSTNSAQNSKSTSSPTPAKTAQHLHWSRNLPTRMIVKH